MLTRARKGFTLLELIVVLVILGLLAAIAIPTYAQVIEKTKQNKNRTTVGAVAREATALAAFVPEAAGATHLAAAGDDLGAGDLTAVAAPVGAAGPAGTEVFTVDIDGAGTGENTEWCVAMSTDVNGASYVAKASGACLATTTAAAF